jgi:predicted P-loop ATPase
LACPYAGADDTPFNRAIGRIWLIAGVRRIRRPGTKFDTLLVIESPEGKNKSEALRILATRNDWFIDCLDLGAKPKDVIEQTAGTWIVECGELDGLTTREEGAIKSMLSRQADKARAAYGHFAERVERQFIACGTTNEAEWLRNEGRRYWPVRVVRFNLVTLSRDVGQLWAEAAAAEALGESITLPETLWVKAAEVRAERVMANPFQAKLREAIELRPKDNQTWISAKDVWETLCIFGAEQDRAAKRVGQAMRNLGFERRRSKQRDEDHGLPRDAYYYELTQDQPSPVSGPTN